MEDFETANLIADVAAFYPQVRDVVALANSYHGLLAEFEEPLAREAFMQLVRDPETRYFPNPGKVYELCRELRRKPPQQLALAFGPGCAEQNHAVAWLDIVRRDAAYRTADFDGRVRLAEQFWFAGRDGEFLKRCWLELDYIREINDSCIGCKGACRRRNVRGRFAWPRHEKDGDYVVAVLQKCGCG